MIKIGIVLTLSLMPIIYGIYCIIVENLREKPIDWWTIKVGVISGILLTTFLLIVNYFTIPKG